MRHYLFAAVQPLPPTNAIKATTRFWENIRPHLPDTRNWISWFALLLALSAALRLSVALNSTVLYEKDSSLYLAFASQIAFWDFSSYAGERTPGYPIFLFLFRCDPWWVATGQMILGLCSTTLLFWAGWRLTQNAFIAALAGSAMGLNLSQIRWEFYMLPESLVTFLLIAACVLFLVVRMRSCRCGVALLALLGCCASGAALTKPLFLVVPALMALALLVRFRIRALPFLITGVLPVAAWIVFMAWRFSYPGMTTLAGFNLTNHSGAFIEYAPDEFRALRDPYLEARKKNNGEHRQLIWRLAQPLVDSTGIPFGKLSQEYGRMSAYLFLRHPQLYLKSVALSWWKFLDARGNATWDGSRHPWMNRLLANVVWRSEGYVLVLLNLIFLIVAGGILRKLLHPETPDGVRVLQVYSLIILFGQLSQALMERDENARYGIPFQPLTILIVVVTLWAVMTQPGHSGQRRRDDKAERENAATLRKEEIFLRQRLRH